MPMPMLIPMPMMISWKGQLVGGELTIAIAFTVSCISAILRFLQFCFVSLYYYFLSMAF